MVAVVFGMAAGQATVLAPPIGAGEEAVEVRTIGRPSSIIGIVFVIAGTLFNFYATKKYKSEYDEIRERQPRPEGVFVAIGLISTLIVAGLASYIIFAIAGTTSTEIVGAGGNNIIRLES